MAKAKTKSTSEASKITVERVQTGVRIEKKMQKVLKALAEYLDISLGDLLEGIVLHAFEGKSAFGEDTLQRIEALKQVYNMNYDARASHQFIEQTSHRNQGDDELSSSKPDRVAVVSLWAEDVATAAHFYQNVIGLRLLPHLLQRDQHKRPHFDLSGTYLIILKGKPVPAQDSEPSRFPLIAFAIDDLEPAIERLQAHHVELPWGVEENADSRWVMFHDPAGNLIELVQFKGDKRMGWPEAPY
jgi:catechol 2,3-dioxygenase-like lactoylglutathione lyase family enzyme